MLKPFGLLLGVTVALAALGGCDDRHGAKQTSKAEKAGAATQSVSTRLGVGWRAVGDQRVSTWSFSQNHRAAQGTLLAAQTNAPLSGSAPVDGPALDALTPIRVALMSNMLPARASVRIEELVNRASSSVVLSGPESAELLPRAILATAPWNDDTILLWVEVPSITMAEGAAVSVEFDPTTVAAFRTLGDPAALPPPSKTAGGAPGRIAMIYELSPLAANASGKVNGGKTTIRYAILHVGARTDGGAKLDQAVTAADSVGTIDNAPPVVRIAAAAAGFGELLRGDPAMRDLSCNDVIALAQSVQHPDPDGWRARLIALMYRAQPLIDLPPNEAGK
jgi:hypothetical protein